MYSVLRWLFLCVRLWASNWYSANAALVRGPTQIHAGSNTSCYCYYYYDCIPDQGLGGLSVEDSQDNGIKTFQKFVARGNPDYPYSYMEAWPNLESVSDDYLSLARIGMP